MGWQGQVFFFTFTYVVLKMGIERQEAFVRCIKWYFLALYPTFFVSVEKKSRSFTW